MRGTGFPRLCRGLVIVPADGGLLVEGTGRRSRLTGTTATALLPQVLPLLDGTREMASVAVDAGLDHAAVMKMITVLDDCGVLEWPVSATPAPQGGDPHVAAYFSRTIAETGGLDCTEDVAAALASAAVLLVADELTAIPMAEDLTETGVADVRVRATIHSVTAADLSRLAGAARPLVAVHDPALADTALADTVRLVRGTGIPVLRFAADCDITEIGPVFYDDWSACPDCFRSGRAEIPGLAPTAGAAASARPPGMMTQALATASILAMLLRSPAAPRPWHIARTIAPRGRTERFDVVPATGCTECCQPAPPADASPASALVIGYEWQHEIRPDAIAAATVQTPARARRVAALQQERDPFPPGPARDLDKGIPETAALIVGLLARTAGRRRQPAGTGYAMDRWAPSGGNLGSVQLYLASESDPFGLPGTLFRYDDLGHRMVSARADRIPLNRLLAGTGIRPGARDAAVIFVASVRRIGRKYDEFALRLSHLDAGCATLQLSVAAAARHVPVTFAPGWDADLPGLLELEPGDEMVMALAVLSGLAPEGSPECR